jgi:hypothetical protein
MIIMIIILIVRHGDRESLVLFLIPAWQEIERATLNGDRLVPAQMQMLKLTSSDGAETLWQRFSPVGS